MSEPKKYLGKRIKFLGHKLKVIKVVERELGYNRISLSCAPHCCTGPCPMTMEMTVYDFEILCEYIGIAKKVNGLLQRGGPT